MHIYNKVIHKKAIFPGSAKLTSDIKYIASERKFLWQQALYLGFDV